MKSKKTSSEQPGCIPCPMKGDTIYVPVFKRIFVRKGKLIGEQADTGILFILDNANGE